ncbi:MAG: aminopeptidase P family protein [Bacteroidia bacterium]|nr:aminopeptidase P family protein [Bacteroidia bacterium]MBP6721995.1 aminopeptidase P family protein [Bacteroidia bacterium]
MFPTSTYIERRTQLCKAIGSGQILLLGNQELGMNYASNTYHFRQDSTFLYYTGLDRPGLAAIIDASTGETTVFGEELTMDDIVWTGAMPTIAEMAAKAGIEHAKPSGALAPLLDKSAHFLPPYRHDNLIKISELLSLAISAVKVCASTDLVKAVIAQRSIKTAEEVSEIELAVRITNDIHVAAMLAARPGAREADVHAAVQEVIHRNNTLASFPAIISTDGQILHNHAHHNTLKSGRLLLVDFGAEAPDSHYAGDMTRTFPVDARFTERQKAVYQTVLDSQMAAIRMLRPGLPYKEAHLGAARVVAEGMKSLGLMKGDLDAAVAAGAHALFFPHGLGHMMGLDVHDMEDLGENFVGYGDGFERSAQFGLAFLRMARPLRPGFVVTVEPGIYFIPQLIDQWRSQGLHKDFINYDEVEKFKDFGGIRIEDDYLITEDGARILGGNVPKTIEDVEALRQVALS